MDKSFHLIHGCIDDGCFDVRNVKKRKAVITGIGIVSPIGNTIDDVIQNLKASKGAMPQKVYFLDSSFPSLPVFRAISSSHPDIATNSERYITFGLQATETAVRDSGIKLEKVSEGNVGVVVSSSKGGVQSMQHAMNEIHTTGVLQNPKYYFENAGPESLSLCIAHKYMITGPVKSVATACATGTHSIISGARMIEDGVVDVCIVGASDASIDPLMLAGYHRMGVYSLDMIRPFDRRRDGFLIGEGAGVLVLESEEHAHARAARVYAEIEAFSEGQETHNALHYDVETNALSYLLKKMHAALHFCEIDYINAHATGTQAGDAYETDQIKKGFGAHAYRIPVSSTKAFTGHLLGASGAVEAIFSLLALTEGFVPPTLHYAERDEACDLDYVPNQMRTKKMQRVLSLSMGFGGHIGILVFKKV